LKTVSTAGYAGNDMECKWYMVRFCRKQESKDKFIDSKTLKNKADEKVVEINMMKGRECVQTFPKGRMNETCGSVLKKGKIDRRKN